MRVLKSEEYETKDAKFFLQISKTADGRYIGNCFGSTPKLPQGAPAGSAEPTVTQLPLEPVIGISIDEVTKKCREAIQGRYGPIVA